MDVDRMTDGEGPGVIARALSAITTDASWRAPIEDACNRYDIDTDDRIAMFLAQCAHESQGFTRMVESLHYSASGLLAEWPKRFTPDEAVAFAYQDEKIGERVYGGRMGNAPEGSGDGFRYRGRGLLQVTGRTMYRKAAINVGPDFEALPELLEQQTWAAVASAWVWADQLGCNELADDGRLQSIVLRINGGMTGMADRLAWLDKVREAMG